MTDVVTWPMVGMALVVAIPGLLAAILAYKGKKLGEATEAKVEQVHVLVNSRMTEIQEKLKVALDEIGALKGMKPLTIAEAPVAPEAPITPPTTFKDLS